MDQMQLKNFVLLAQTLNYSAVAKQEFISQPALTKQINRLEEELGVRLFHRTRHDVSLTFAGEEFYRHAADILDSMDRALHHMEDIKRGQTGSLEISAIFGLDDVIAGTVSGFTASYPEVRVNITSGSGAQQVLAINRQTADLFFSFAPLLELYPSIETLPLSEDRMAVFVHKKDVAPLRERGLSYLDELNHLIEYRSEGGPLFTGMIFSIRDTLGLSAGPSFPRRSAPSGRPWASRRTTSPTTPPTPRSSWPSRRVWALLFFPPRRILGSARTMW